MEHRIKVRIGDRSYPKVITSEDEEEAIRKAAVSVNDKISLLTRAYPKVSLLDIATIAAVNEGIEKFELKRKLEKMENEMEKLSSDLQNYVDSLK